MNASAGNSSAVLHLVRVTIEAQSPVSAASGEVVRVKRPRMERGKKTLEDALEAALLRDANGLPALSGATTQGVLRRLYVETHQPNGEKLADQIFGYVRDAKDGKAGRLVVGFGAIHTSSDAAVVGLASEEDLADDLIKALRDSVSQDEDNDQQIERFPGRTPVRRDHVKMDHRHVADGAAKFERLAVPVGTRFSFEMAMWGVQTGSEEGNSKGLAGAEEDKATLAEIVDLMAHPAFRLGGASRRGYGKIKLLRASYAQANLNDPRASDSPRSLRKQRASTHFDEHWYWEGKKEGRLADAAADVVTLTLQLTPINPWRVGGVGRGDELVLTERTRSGSRLPTGAEAPDETGLDADRRGNPDGGIRPDIQTAVREPVIVWNGGTGKLKLVFGVTTDGAPVTSFDRSADAIAFLVPGSALKGPIAHRTLFHWNRMLENGAGLIDAGSLDGLTGQAAVTKAAELLKPLKDRPRKLENLFGAAKRPEDKNAAVEDKVGRAARIIVDDAAVTGVTAVQAIDHVSIDRFTGGARSGALYVEEVLVGGTINATLTILPPIADKESRHDNKSSSWSDPVHAAVIKAFCDALSDLCQGRLAIGAKSLGFCSGTIAWEGGISAIGPWKEAWNAVTTPPADARGAAA